MKIYCFYANHW